MTPAKATVVTTPDADVFEEAVALTKRLRLPYLRETAADGMPAARAQRWDPAEILRVLLAEKAAGRDAATIRSQRHRAGFPRGKTFDIWDQARTSIARPTQQALRTLEWVPRAENLCICGPSGTGKSHFTEALGQFAVDSGMSVSWFTAETLDAQVTRHRADGSVAKAIARIIRNDLIVVDDPGMLPIGEDAAEGFYRLVDAAYGRRSVLVTSNLHPSGFDELMSKTISTALVDGLLHHAHVVVAAGAPSGSPKPPPARG